MILQSKHMVRVLAKGGILTPSYLLSILKIVKESGKSHIYFGSRQDILFNVYKKQMPKVREALETLQTDYIIHRRKEAKSQNIVSSYVSADMIAATPWLSSGNYLYILEQFDYKPFLRINISDPKQSLVPLFYGHLNFVASTTKDFWYLYIRKNENSLPERWPVLIINSDIGILSKSIEEHWHVLKESVTSDLFDLVHEKTSYNWRKIEVDLKIESIPPHDYEGFGKMYTSHNYWAGFYWRNNKYDIAFLEEVSNLCLKTNISKICLTPWKSFLVKEIQEKDLFHWHRLLGRFGINMRHSSFELNWHLPILDKSTLRLKRFIVKEFDHADVCVHGLTFGIKTKPEPSFTSIVIEKIPGIKILKNLDPFITYRISFAQNFNANSCQYEEYMPQMPRYRLPGALQSLTLKFYAQLLKSSESKTEPAKANTIYKHIVFQCQNCFTIYDEKIGDKSRSIASNTLFSQLPETFCCALCESPKADFKVVSLSHIIKEANS